MCSFFFSSRRRHTRLQGDWSSDVCSSDLFWRQSNGKAAGLLRYDCCMIRVTVNGDAQRFDAPLDVAALLARLDCKGRKVAVERNGEIVPRSAHGSTLIADGDRLEIVVAVGGG